MRMVMVVVVLPAVLAVTVARHVDQSNQAGDQNDGQDIDSLAVRRFMYAPEGRKSAPCTDV